MSRYCILLRPFRKARALGRGSRAESLLLFVLATLLACTPSSELRVDKGPESLVRGAVQRVLLEGAGFDENTRISISPTGFSGSNPAGASDGRPAKLIAHGTRLEIFLAPGLSPERDSVGLTVSNTAHDLTVSFQVALRPSRSEVQEVLDDLTPERLLGQLFIIGYDALTNSIRPSNEGLIRLVREFEPGGVILYEHNMPRPTDRRDDFFYTTRTLADLTKQLQSASDLPLLIAIDQEGGTANRVRQGVSQFPEPAFLTVTRNPWLVYSSAEAVGRELRLLGINTNFAPVVDIDSTHPQRLVGKHKYYNPVIGRRSFGSLPQHVSALSAAYALGLRTGGVLPVGKHFPGHGRTLEDPHKTLPVITYSLPNFSENDLLPYRNLIALGIPALMTAHISVAHWDDLPVTFSHKAIQELRAAQNLNFSGLILTDDLSAMESAVATGGNTRRSRTEAVRQAVSVGHDMVILGYIYPDEKLEQAFHERDLREVFSILLEEFEGRQEELKERVRRILMAKASLAGGDVDAEALREIGYADDRMKELLDSHRDLAETIIKSSVVVVTEQGKESTEPLGLFGKDKGPLRPKTGLVPQNARICLVSPVFFNYSSRDEREDELLDEIRRVGSPWLANDLEVVRMTYGFGKDHVEKARQVWGDLDENIEWVESRDELGNYQFDEAEASRALDAKVAEIQARAEGTHAIVFAAVTRAQVEILERLARAHAADGIPVIALVFKEPYLLSMDLLTHPSFSIVFLSAIPDLKEAAQVLFGEKGLEPKAATHLPFQTAFNVDLTRGPELVLEVPKDLDFEAAEIASVALTKLRPPAIARRAEPPDPWMRGIYVLGAVLLGFVGATLALIHRRRKRVVAPNNTWHSGDSSDSVVVFVHGVLSDASSCWRRNLRGGSSVYWPDLVRDEPALANVGVFLGGYYTAVDQGDFAFKDSAWDLLQGLKNLTGDGPSVLDKRAITFVCHSTGGIVARYMLERHHEEFKDLKIGLVLIASPSLGSELANELRPLVRFYNHRVGEQLRWQSPDLSDLHGRFRDLVKERKLDLVGVEAYENHFIIRWRWLPFFARKRVVTGVSAGQYFGDPVLLANTDHFSSVKPDGRRHPAHQLLVNFMNENGLLQPAVSSQTAPKSAVKETGARGSLGGGFREAEEQA